VATGLLSVMQFKSVFFLLRHFGQGNISVVCFTVVSEVAITVFIQPIFLDILTEMT